MAVLSGSLDILSWVFPHLKNEVIDSQKNLVWKGPWEII